MGWAIGLKASEGFTRPYISIATVIMMILSFVVLAQGLKSLPVGTAYAVWTGIGVLGTAVLGMMFFNESRDIAGEFTSVAAKCRVRISRTLNLTQLK